MTQGVEKIGEYIERLFQLSYKNDGYLNVRTATKMLAVVKCLEAPLLAYLSKLKL